MDGQAIMAVHEGACPICEGSRVVLETVGGDQEVLNQFAAWVAESGGSSILWSRRGAYDRGQLDLRCLDCGAAFVLTLHRRSGDWSGTAYPLPRKEADKTVEQLTGWLERKIAALA